MHGIFANLACLGLLHWLTRREGLRLLDLVAVNRQRIRRDVLLGLGLALIGIPLVVGGSILW